MRRRDAEIKRVAKFVVNDDRFDEHLREQHVQLPHNFLDRGHVLPGCEDEQRVTSVVGNDFCLAKNLDGFLLSRPRRGAVDDGLKPLAESVATGGRARRSRLVWLVLTRRPRR